MKVHHIRWSHVNKNELEFYRLTTTRPSTKYFLGHLKYEDTTSISEEMIDDPSSIEHIDVPNEQDANNGN